MSGDQHKHKRILGVDGGGSKTIAWIADVVPSSGHRKFELEVIGRGHAGPSNPRSVGFDAAFANLSAAILMARGQIAPTFVTMDAACLSLAGAGRSEEQNRIREWAELNHLAKQTIVVDDVEPLRLAAMYEQNQSQVSNAESWEKSITLVVGTGSIACGQNGEGRSVRVGGWGYLLGDEGSGFFIGLTGLQSLCKAHDRAEIPTAFQKALLQRLGLSTPTELVRFIYQTPLPRAQVAGLSQVVIGHASNDPAAEKILADSIQAMTELVATAAQRLELAHRSYSLALSGGVVSNHAIVVDRLMHELERMQLSPGAHHSIREPIYGPLTMAMEMTCKPPVQ